MDIITLALAKKYADEKLTNIDSLSTQSDWGQNDENAVDYVKNRPFYSTGEYEYIEILNTAVDGKFGLFYAIFNASVVLSEHQLYQVIINNTDDYLLTAYRDADGYICLGNVDTDSFCFTSASNLALIEAADSLIPKHIIIKEAVEKIQYLDKKYVSNFLAGERVTNKEVTYKDKTYTCQTGAEIFNIGNTAIGVNSHAEGQNTVALESNSHAEGMNTEALGSASHAEGSGTVASGPNAHAEGGQTEASGSDSHAEGYLTQASGLESHTEGRGTIANTSYLHVQGTYNLPEDIPKYSEVWSMWSEYPEYDGDKVIYIFNKQPTFNVNEGTFSVAEYPYESSIKELKKGNYFVSVYPESDIINTYYHASELISTRVDESTGKTYYKWKYSGAGCREFSDKGKYAHIVGNGKGRIKYIPETDSYEEHRSNAHTLNWDGTAWFAGDVYVGSTSGVNRDEGSKKLATEDFVNEQINQLSQEKASKATTLAGYGITDGVTKEEFNQLSEEIDDLQFNGLCGVNTIKTNKNLLQAWIDTDSMKLLAGDNVYCIYCEIFPNTTYTIKKVAGSPFRIATTSEIPNLNVSIIQTIANHTGDNITLRTTDNEKYLCIYYYNGADSSEEKRIRESISVIYGKTLYDISEKVAPLADAVNEYVYSSEYLVNGGCFINPTGDSQNNDSFSSSDSILIPKEVEKFTIEKSSTIPGGCAIAFYNSEKVGASTFISGVPIVDTNELPKEVAVPSDATHVVFSARNENEFLVSTGKYYANNIQEINRSIYGITNKHNFSEKILSCDFIGKIMHFSFDDVHVCLNNLINNNYASVFDEPFFSFLKSQHDKYGCVFTLNVICRDTGFNIENLPTKYQSELSNASKWLKFSFHSYWSGDLYDEVQGIVNYYRLFLNGIYKLTGTYDSVDRFMRLASFKGSLNNCKLLRDTEYGALGFLSADDDRQSYYLNSTPNSIAINKGKYFDLENELVFIRSCTRLENIGKTALTEEITSNLPRQQMVEIFMHEQNYNADASGLGARIDTVFAWAKENGYIFEYPMNIFN